RLRRSALRDTAPGAAASAAARATVRACPALRDCAAMAASATRQHGGGAVGAPARRPAYSRIPRNLRTASPDTVGRLWCGGQPDITANAPVSGGPPWYFRGEAMSVYETARAHMIESQLRPNKVTDERVIGAFAQLRRELFVPEHLRGVAYIDEDLPVGDGRYLMQPMVAARLLQIAAVEPKETALVVGAGVGYEAALLSLLARSVVAHEEHAELARFGRSALVEHGIATASYVESPLP